VLAATAAETGYAISIVFLFNFAAVLTFPTDAYLVGMGPSVFAVWAGTAINDTSSVPSSFRRSSRTSMPWSDPIRGTRRQESQPGDREVRRQLRLVLKNAGLPPSGDLYDRAYAYIREHY
jgi:hypothetical protein